MRFLDNATSTEEEIKMSITVKKEQIEFLQIPAEIRAKILFTALNGRSEQVMIANDPDYEWGELIWGELGEEPFGFFYALRGFQRCIEKAIEIEEYQLNRWNITKDDLEQIFEKDQLSFYLSK